MYRSRYRMFHSRYRMFHSRYRMFHSRYRMFHSRYRKFYSSYTKCPLQFPDVSSLKLLSGQMVFLLSKGNTIFKVSIPPLRKRKLGSHLHLLPFCKEISENFLSSPLSSSVGFMG
jgi:hypothetical protein